MGSPGKKNTVCLSLEFWHPGINPELMVEWIERTSNMVNMLEVVARNNNIVLWRRINKIASWMSFEELGDKQLLLNHQCSTEIFFLLLLLLPNMLSIDRQTNEKIVGIDSEDFPSFSRNEPLRFLLDALAVNDEED